MIKFENFKWKDAGFYYLISAAVLLTV